MGGLRHCPEGLTSAPHYEQETGMNGVVFLSMMKVYPVTRFPGTVIKFYHREHVELAEKLKKLKVPLGNFTIDEFLTIYPGMEPHELTEIMSYCTPKNIRDEKRYHISSFVNELDLWDYRILEDKIQKKSD